MGRGAGLNRRQNAHGNAEELAEKGVPAQRLQVHQQRPAGVCDVGNVAGAARQAVAQPGVDGAEGKAVLLRRRPHLGHILQQPANLQRAKVAANGEAGLRLHRGNVRGGLLLENLRDQLRGAVVQPDDAVVEGLA